METDTPTEQNNISVPLRCSNTNTKINMISIKSYKIIIIMYTFYVVELYAQYMSQSHLENCNKQGIKIHKIKSCQYKLFLEKNNTDLCRQSIIDTQS